MSGIFYLVTSAVFMLFAGLFLPVVIALATGDRQVMQNLTVLALLGTFFSLLAVTAISGRIRALNRAQSLLAVVIIWTVCPLVAAMPFVVTATTDPLPALFEAVSGLTTTGASTLHMDGRISLPLMVWRTELEWLGGYLMLACVLHILAPSGIGGLPRSGGRFFRGEHELNRTIELDRFLRLFLQYALATLIVAVLFMMSGVEGFRAMMFAMTAIATGGFVPIEGALHDTVGELARFLFALVLAISATSLLWQRVLLNDIRQAVRQTREAQWILGLIALLSIVYATRLVADGGSAAGGSPLRALSEGFFAAASIVSTSGIEPRPGVIAVLPELLVLFLVLAGASVFSTSGGIKLYRIGGMVLQARRELSLLIFPSSIDATEHSAGTDNASAFSAVWSVFISAVFVIAIAAFLISLQSGFEAGLTMAISLFANAGAIYPALVPPGADSSAWPVFADLEALSMWSAIIVMLLGRLEVLVVFAALNINYWINR